MQTKLKALIDLGKPFISLESFDDSNPYESVPLLLLVRLHSEYWDANLQMLDKTELLLTRGANVKARNSRGQTCLHLAFLGHIHSSLCWCKIEFRLWVHRYRTTDLVILLITAGADVCAVDGEGESVSDVAIRSGQQALWTHALKCCGIDIKDVLARPNFDPAHSTALSTQYTQPPRSVTSKRSFEEHLERRKAIRYPSEREFSDLPSLLGLSEDDDSGDEDSNSGLSPSENDKNGDEDWTAGASEVSEADEQQLDDTPIPYESRGKAKLD